MTTAATTAADAERDHRLATEAVYTFAAAMDFRDWELYRSVFGEQIELDYSFFHPDQLGPIAAEAWVANVRERLSRLTATQHAMTNPRTTVAEGRATCTVYTQAQHVVTVEEEEISCLVGGQYTFGLVRTDVGWLIDAVALRPLLIIGDQRVLDVARA